MTASAELDRMIDDAGALIALAEHNERDVPLNATMKMAEAGAGVVPGLTATQAASIYRAMLEAR